WVYPVLWSRFEYVARVARTVPEPFSTWTLSVSYAVVVDVSAVSTCSQKLNWYELHPAGRVMDWASVSVWLAPYPSSQASQLPVCGGSLLLLLITPAVDDHGAALPVSKPGLSSSWVGMHEVIVQVKLAEADGPVESVAVTVTE